MTGMTFGRGKSELQPRSFVTNTEQLFATVIVCYSRREIIGSGFVHKVCTSPFSSTVNLFMDSEDSLEPPPFNLVVLVLCSFYSQCFVFSLYVMKFELKKCYLINAKTKQKQYNLSGIVPVSVLSALGHFENDPFQYCVWPPHASLTV